MRIVLSILLLAWAVLAADHVEAQTLNSGNVQIEWKVTNRFRLFRNTADFALHEQSWKVYKSHVEALALTAGEKDQLIATTSVIGTEHVLNDRYIPFTRHVRSKYDARGWAAGVAPGLCWEAKSRSHAACGGSEAYVSPASHEIEVWLKPLVSGTLIAEYNCQWRVGDTPAIAAPCDEPVTVTLPYPGGASIAVNVEGETPISIEAAIRDLLIVGLGDSFASGEGNPDVPVAMTQQRRYKNLYPKRAANDASGSAQWLDETCHRSLYGHQLRAALQVAIENPRAAVTFLGYACSGAAIADGILGPQTYVEYVSQSTDGTVKTVSGSAKDTQLRWLLRELCVEKPDKDNGFWTCPGGKFRRTVDFVLLSVGGNDIGFSNLVAWATLRDNTSSTLAKFFGATVSAKQFGTNMRDDLPGAYARLAKAIEIAVPVKAGDIGFDPSRVVLSAYPDILEDEAGRVCAAGEEGKDEDLYPANQSLDLFSSWLVVTPKRLEAAHAQLEKLHARMGELAEDHGWTFAGRAYQAKPFRGHGFCAQNKAAVDEPAEQLMIPCWGKAERPTLTCESSWSGKQRQWRPYNPVEQNYPYALRQRWVRTFNDAYMVVNQKVIDRRGQVDERASEAVFSATTGAMHPTAEGHAAMADAILLDLRPALAEALAE